MDEETMSTPFDPLSLLDEEQLQILKDFKERIGLKDNLTHNTDHGEDDNDENERGYPLTPELRTWLDDMCLCRYLRARDWDLDAAFKMITSSIRWRHEYKPDEITSEEIESEAESGKMYFVNSFDKFGCPIIYMKPRRDNSTDREIKLKYLVYVLEQAIKSMDSTKGVEKMTWICDFKGTGLRTSSMGNIQVSIDVLQTLQSHYPERLAQAFLVNCPWVFSAFWRMISPILNEVTASKVKFISGKKEFIHILERIDADVLEKEYGGVNEWEYDHEEWVNQNFASSLSAKTDVDNNTQNEEEAIA